MKNYLSFFILLLSTYSFAQQEWVKENASTYSIGHPESWLVRPTETSGEVMMSGPTPDFKENKKSLGTTLYISSESSKYSTIDSASVVYKEKLLHTDFLENTVIQKEEKIKFKGVDAIEITFTTKIQKISTVCRMILFQYNDVYYELSVTYDKRLSKKLLNEAYEVMESFEFID